MTNHAKRLGIACAAWIAAGSLFLSVTTAIAAEDNATLVSSLLSQAKTQAFQLKEDAYELQLFTMVPPSAYSATEIRPESHAESIRRITADVNALTEKVAKLQSMRNMAAPWQQKAIDEIKPLLSELASNTTVLIQYIDKNPNKLYAPEYREYVEANSDTASQLASLIGVYVDYGKARERSQRLRDKMGLPLN